MAGYPLAKLTELEQAMAALAQAQVRTETNLDRLEANLDRHATETRANLDRLEANLDRYAAETHAGFADTRAGFAETRASLDRLDANVAQSLKLAGDAVNRVGRLVEDIVAPTLHDLFSELFSWQGPVASAIRIRRGDKEREFDAYATAGEHFLLMSAKGTIAGSDITDLLAILPDVRDYFPEAANRKVHGAIGSLYADPSVVAGAERRGIYVIGLRPGITTVLNSKGFIPAAF